MASFVFFKVYSNLSLHVLKYVKLLAGKYQVVTYYSQGLSWSTLCLAISSAKMLSLKLEC
jgi:hypothetical protein